jgi:hypothetical protein
MSNSLVTLESFPNTISAEQARIALAAEGIQAFVEGGATDTLLSHVGSALGGVKLTVRESDVQRAAAILSESFAEDKGANWHCRDCDEEVDAGFDVCWSCGKNRDEVAREDSSNDDSGIKFIPGLADFVDDDPFARGLKVRRRLG